MNIRTFVIATVASIVVTGAADVARANGLERLYIIDCGHSLGPDQSRWTPGVNVGTPLPMVGNCYLIKHAQGWLVWDTGHTDAIAKMPNGQPGKDGSPHWWRPKTLEGEIKSLGLQPSDIKYLAISHSHPDHIGNVNLFPQSTLLIQRAEYDWPSPFGPRFKPSHPVMKLDGDHDVFGDGSVMIFSTPGHTPGSQVLLVKLKKHGPVILTGDAVHVQESWDRWHIPANNTDREQTIKSYQRIGAIMAEHRAVLWINHDAPQRAKLRLSPEYYE